MKSYYLIIGIFLIVFNTGLRSQIVIDSTDMPFSGNIINISTGLNIDFIDYTETGEDFTWDFSSLIPVYQTADTFVSPSQTPFTYQFFFMGRTNLAYRYLDDLPIPDFELTNVFYFYKNSQTSYVNAGYAASLNVLPLPFVLSTPDVLYRFPLEYGHQDSSVSGLVYNLPETAYLSIDRKRVNKVDGWGTLITPFGTFEVLRMTSEVTEYDSIYIDSLEMGVPVNRHYTEYKWLAKGQKIPVLKITSDVSGLIVTYTDSVRIDYDAVNEKFIKSESVRVYPNPTSTYVFIEFEATEPVDAEVILLDMLGKCIFRRSAAHYLKGVNRSHISLKDKAVPKGTYLLYIRSDGQMLTKKLVINN
ncbi:MAG: T9SS type A sorting domain-containing protein [Bacteroidetes bacterium]|nr:T9SS type A sorting domain-containing protein [Bacteroidota bacterium]